MIKNRNYLVFTPSVWPPIVVLSEGSSVLCENTLSMDCMKKEYAAFERAMDEEKLYREISDYVGICALIDADPIRLDRILYEELGWHGQDLVDYYCRCENIHQ